MSIENLPICSRNEVSEFLENELLPKWRKGNPTLFRIEPEHVDTRIEKTVKSVIINNGTYETGDRVVVNSRPDALPMAAEIGHVLDKLGYKTCIIYGLFGDPSSINKLLAVLPNRKSLEQVAGQYGALVDFAQHWVVPYATAHSEPNRAEKEAVLAFTRIVNKGLSKVDEKRERGEIKSVDVVDFRLRTRLRD